MEEQIHKETGLTSPAALRAYLDELAVGINFVHGSGRRKSPEQRKWESLAQLLERRERYEESRATMSEGRSSYSKIDTDATFMRIKENHMRNGQLKPGYNVQIAVNSAYITGIEAFSDRTDVKTLNLKPFLRRLEDFHCAQGRKLPLRRECTQLRDSQFVSTAWHRCESCTGCPCRSQCCRAKDLE